MDNAPYLASGKLPEFPHTMPIPEAADQVPRLLIRRRGAAPTSPTSSAHSKGSNADVSDTISVLPLPGQIKATYSEGGRDEVSLIDGNPRLSVHLDMVPTYMDYLDLDPPVAVERYSQGRSLLTPLLKSALTADTVTAQPSNLELLTAAHVQAYFNMSAPPADMAMSMLPLHSGALLLFINEGSHCCRRHETAVSRRQKDGSNIWTDCFSQPTVFSRKRQNNLRH